jgi:hypothetical protein
MICLRCGHDSKYKDRADRRCPACGAPFAFEPAKGDKLTDKAFQAAIDRVSANGKLRWGVEHLYYDVARRARPFPLLTTIAALGIGAGVAAGSLTGKWQAFAAVLAITVALIAWLLFERREGDYVGLDRGKFDSMWARWRETHGTPPGLIVRAAAPPAPRTLAPDVADYSFDRAVICDRARTVDLLLANNFHFENNCAVLAMNGYPLHAFDTVKKMLLRNPRLQVFALHDATQFGCRMAERLAKGEEWFKRRARVIDVGLRPAQTLPLRKLCVRPTGPVAAGGGISALEARWLSSYAVELAALPPEQILKRLFRAINKYAQDEEEFDYDRVDQDESFSTYGDAVDAEGDADGFG